MATTAYVGSTRVACVAVPGAFLVDLAGGCVGVGVPVDGGLLIIARCPDLGDPSYASWGAWVVDADGEQVLPLGDGGAVDIGLVRPRDFAGMPGLALRVLVGSGE